MRKIFLVFILLFSTAFSYDIEKQADIGDILDDIDVEAGVSIDIFPDRWNFGTILEDCESPAFPFIVTNDGGLPVYIRKSYIDGDDKKHFYIKEDNCKDKILAVGDTCTIKVVFKPRDEGKRDAELVVRYYGDKNIEKLIEELIDGEYEEESADLEGVGLPSPTGDFIDYDDFCPDYPDYELPKEVEDRGEDPDDIFGCKLGSGIDLTLFLISVGTVALILRRTLK